MISILLNGFVGTIIAIVIFLLIFDPVEKKSARGITIKNVAQSRWTRLGQYANAVSKRRTAKSPPVAKEVIKAMAHRAVYRLDAGVERADDCDGEDECDIGQWARKHLASTCAKLDGYQPEVLKLERITDAFCSRLNATCDTFEANLCEHRDQLALITEARISLERELNLLAEYQPTKPRQTVKGKVDGCPSYPIATMTETSVSWSSPVIDEDENYILSGYNYLITDGGNEKDENTIGC